MAAELDVAAVTRTNRPLSIAGTGFAAETAVEVSIIPENITVTVESDIGGDFDLDTVLTWAPSRTGEYTVRADDGTDVVTADVQVYSTT